MEDGLAVRNCKHNYYFQQTKDPMNNTFQKELNILILAELAKGPTLAPANFLTAILSLSDPDRQRLFGLYDNAEELFNDFKAQNFPDPAISLSLLKQIKG